MPIKNAMKWHKYWLIKISTMFLFIYSTGGCAMGLLGEKVYLFSEVNGVLTLNHQPLKGAKVIRTVEWKEEKFVDEATTAEDGSFSMPVRKGKGRIFLAEFVAYQTIDVEYEGKTWQIWMTIKRSPSLNEELIDDDNHHGMPIQFTCELSDNDKRIKLLASVLRTKCKFPRKIGEEF